MCECVCVCGCKTLSHPQSASLHSAGRVPDRQDPYGARLTRCDSANTDDLLYIFKGPEAHSGLSSVRSCRTQSLLKKGDVSRV